MRSEQPGLRSEPLVFFRRYNHPPPVPISQPPQDRSEEVCLLVARLSTSMPIRFDFSEDVIGIIQQREGILWSDCQSYSVVVSIIVLQ